MAAQEITVILKGEAADLVRAFNEAGNAAKKTTSVFQKTEKELKTISDFRGFRSNLIKQRDALASNETQLSSFNRKIAQTEATISRMSNVGLRNNVAALGRASMATKRFASASGSANFAILGLSQGVQDLPFGFIGIQNNIPMVIRAFSQLKQETGSTKKAFSSLGKSLMGSGGLFLGVSLLITGITLLTQKYGSLGNAIKAIFGTFNEADQIQTSLNKAFEDSKEPLSQTIKNVVSLKEKVSLAKDELIKGETVIKQYNDTIGKTAGKVDTLNEVEKKLIDRGDDIIKLTLKKSVAQNILAQATSARAKAEIMAANKFKGVGGVFNAIFQGAKSSLFGGLFSNPLSGLTKQISTPLEKASTLMDLYKKKMKEVAEFAKNAGLNLFPNSKNNLNNSKETLSVLEKLADQIRIIKENANIFGGATARPGFVSPQQVSIINAYADALKQLIQDGKEGTQVFSQLRNTLVGMTNAIAPIEVLRPDFAGARQQNIEEGTSKIVYLDDTREKIEAVTKATTDWGQAANIVGGVLENVFSVVANGKNVLDSLAKSAQRLIVKLTAAAAAAALISLIPGAGGFLSLFGKISGIPFGGAHANGAFVNSPQLAIIGDDNTGGEWVLNQHQISALISNVSGGSKEIRVTGEFIQRGNDLVAVVDTTKEMNKIF